MGAAAARFFNGEESYKRAPPCDRDLLCVVVSVDCPYSTRPLLNGKVNGMPPSVCFDHPLPRTIREQWCRVYPGQKIEQNRREIGGLGDPKENSAS